jgi:hypothetical protein
MRAFLGIFGPVALLVSLVGSVMLGVTAFRHRLARGVLVRRSLMLLGAGAVAGALLLWSGAGPSAPSAPDAGDAPQLSDGERQDLDRMRRLLQLAQQDEVEPPTPTKPSAAAPAIPARVLPAPKPVEPEVSRRWSPVGDEPIPLELSGRFVGRRVRVRTRHAEYRGVIEQVHGDTLVLERHIKGGSASFAVKKGEIVSLHLAR